ncbi:MAG: TOBE domain-containing protein, partial [Candidatus Eremiobacteraeota bacterium]|nr:TOBE domain-containing protein [Candidatus Eremiobacteraeota bacterium]
GSVTVRAAAPVTLPHGPVVISIRPQHVVLRARAGGDVPGENAFGGRITRQTYLGEIRDYLIDVDGGGQLRAVTDPSVRHDVGADVIVELPRERCRIVEA